MLCSGNNCSGVLSSFNRDKILPIQQNMGGVNHILQWFGLLLNYCCKHFVVRSSLCRKLVPSLNTTRCNCINSLQKISRPLAGNISYFHQLKSPCNTCTKQYKQLQRESQLIALHRTPHPIPHTYLQSHRKHWWSVFPAGKKKKKKVGVTLCNNLSSEKHVTNVRPVFTEIRRITFVTTSP